jgi:hypothetical protein
MVLRLRARLRRRLLRGGQLNVPVGLWTVGLCCQMGPYERQEEKHDGRMGALSRHC